MFVVHYNSVTLVASLVLIIAVIAHIENKHDAVVGHESAIKYML